MVEDEVEKAKEYIRLGRQRVQPKPEGVVQGEPDISREDNPEIDPKLLAMFPPKRLAGIMKRELRRYQQAQTKKWKKWLEAVSR